MFGNSTNKPIFYLHCFSRENFKLASLIFIIFEQLSLNNDLYLTFKVKLYFCFWIIAAKKDQKAEIVAMAYSFEESTVCPDFQLGQFFQMGWKVHDTPVIICLRFHHWWTTHRFTSWTVIFVYTLYSNSAQFDTTGMIPCMAYI